MAVDGNSRVGQGRGIARVTAAKQLGEPCVSLDGLLPFADGLVELPQQPAGTGVLGFQFHGLAGRLHGLVVASELSQDLRAGILPCIGFIGVDRIQPAQSIGASADHAMGFGDADYRFHAALRIGGELFELAHRLVVGTGPKKALGFLQDIGRGAGRLGLSGQQARRAGHDDQQYRKAESRLHSHH